MQKLHINIIDDDEVPVVGTNKQDLHYLLAITSINDMIPGWMLMGICTIL